MDDYTRLLSKSIDGYIEKEFKKCYATFGGIECINEAVYMLSVDYKFCPIHFYMFKSNCMELDINKTSDTISNYFYTQINEKEANYIYNSLLSVNVNSNVADLPVIVKRAYSHNGISTYRFKDYIIKHCSREISGRYNQLDYRNCEKILENKGRHVLHKYMITVENYIIEVNHPGKDFVNKKSLFHRNQLKEYVEFMGVLRENCTESHIRKEKIINNLKEKGLVIRKKKGANYVKRNYTSYIKTLIMKGVDYTITEWCRYASRDAINQFTIDIAQMISRFHKKGILLGDVSLNNIAVRNNKPVLISYYSLYEINVSSENNTNNINSDIYCDPFTGAFDLLKGKTPTKYTDLECCMWFYLSITNNKYYKKISEVRPYSLSEVCKQKDNILKKVLREHDVMSVSLKNDTVLNVVTEVKRFIIFFSNQESRN